MGSKRKAKRSKTSQKRPSLKQKQACVAVGNLIASLPSRFHSVWLNVNEVHSLLVDGGVHDAVPAKDIRNALKQLFKNQLFECRHWGSAKVLYYRLAKHRDDPSTPDMHPPLSDIDPIDSDYFALEQFANDLKTVNDYVREIAKGSANKGSSGEEDVNEPCRGWSGPAYNRLILMSAKECLEQSFDSSLGAKPIPPTFPLSSIFKERKDSSNFYVECKECDGESEQVYHIRSKCCTDSSEDGKLCMACKNLSQSLANINHQANKEVKIHGSMHITESSVARMSAKDVVDSVGKIRHEKDGQIRNVTRENGRLKENMNKAKNVEIVHHPNCVDNLHRLMKAALPIAENIWGKDSMKYHVFEQQFEDLKGNRRDENGKLSTGLRYNPEVTVKAMAMVRDADPKTYETFQDILYLPDRKGLKKKLRDEMAQDEDGACVKAIEKMAGYWTKWAADHPEISDGWNEVNVQYDSMRIAAGMMLITRRGQVDRISGVIMPESMDVANSLFDEFVYNVAEERGIGPGEQDQTGAMSDLLVNNTEHSVYYISSVNPHCDMCFIAGVFNTPPLTSTDVNSQLNEVEKAIHRYGFRTRVEVSDCAGPNEGYTNRKCTIPARDLIPADVLNRHGLDGDCLVAYESYVDGKPVFVLDDPPHVLKRLGNSARGNDLQWEWNSEQHPMSMLVLRDVFSATVRQSDEFALQARRKLTMSHFEVNVDRAQKMKVRPIAQVLSNTMVELIDNVCSDPEIDFPKVPFPARKEVLSKVRLLCANMNEWFDLCNSKDPKSRNPNWRVWTKADNAVEMADKFLKILKFFQDWKESVTDDTGKVHLEHFITMETYKSLQRCCYGFASMIYEMTIRGGRPIALWRVNQDPCENHFSHVRAASGNCRHPLQSQADLCTLTSHLKRSIKASKHANVTLLEPPAKRQRKN